MTSIENIITENIYVWSSAIKQRNTQGRGSSKKQELYGTQKLRELILELAVRGLLVPQDPNDEPASVLLKKIASEKEQLVKDKKIKKPKKLPAISDNEQFGTLPHGWEYVRLNDIGEWGAGATPRRSSTELYGGDIPWFKSGELIADYIYESEETVTEEALNKASLRYNKAGDVLLAMYGATIGKTAILAVPGTTNQAVCACTPFTGFSNTFLLTLLKAYRPRFIGMGAGGAQPNISREKIIATVIALPPENEQERIVAKVDELMALCDQLEQQQENSIAAHQQLVETLLAALIQAADNESFEQAWSRIAANFETLFTTENSIDQLKQTLLQLAVMGKLVPQDPNDEPAAVLVEEIFKTKIKLEETENLKTKAKEAIDAAEHYIDKPAAWEFVRLGNLAKFIDYRGRTPSKIKSGIPLITAKNIKYGFVSREPAEFISEEDYEEWMTRGFPRLKDVLFTTEAPLGNVALIDIEEKFALAQRAICFQLHEPLVAEYLVYLIMSKPFQEQLADNATGMTAKGIKASKLKEIVVPMPPIAEQKRIVAKVDQLFAICDQLKTKINSAQQTQLQLADAITSQAIQ